MQKKYRALEFFSGIGAFAQVGDEFGLEIVQAFDQGQDANLVYEFNYKQSPSTRNLDSIKDSQIEEADIWWMSPSCLPYTRKGKNADIEDARAQSFLNLTGLIPKILPERIFIENVPEFEQSKAMGILEKKLKSANYNFKTFNLCSTELGTPMLRRRFFLAASRTGPIEDIEIEATVQRPLSEFINKNADASLYLDQDTLLKLAAFDIVNGSSPRTTCFTSSYGKQHKASGSLIEESNTKIRYFSAEEILSLLGFSSDFKFLTQMSNKTKWRLAGNSVDTRIIKLLLKASGL